MPIEPAVLIAALLAAAVASAANGQESLGLADEASQDMSCQWSLDHTPAQVVESEVWNYLEPTDVNGIPTCQTQLCESRDTSWHNPANGYTLASPLWRWLDIEGGYIFAAVNLGIQIWDVHHPGSGAGSAERPDRLAYVGDSILLTQVPGSHDFFKFNAVDAPKGNANILTATGVSAMGMVVLNTSSKSNPKVLYQDGGPTDNDKLAHGVYATTINGRTYGFLAAYKDIASGTAGLWMYDLTRAQEVGGTLPCWERRPTIVNPTCSGVYRGKLTDVPVSHVAGTGSDANGHYVATGGGLDPSGASANGVRVWSVTNPAAPVQVISGLSSARVHGVAMWEQGANVYLALTKTNPKEGRIYDVSCIKSGPCALPAPLYTFPMEGHTGPGLYVQYSDSNGTPFLYFGHDGWVSTGLSSEWLFDVTNPSAPLDTTGGNPQNGNLGQPTMDVDGTTLGYWSWYSPCSLPTGSNNLEPITGAFWGDHFYRAASTIFDVHKLVGTQPPSTIFADQFESGDFSAWSAVVP